VVQHQGDTTKSTDIINSPFGKVWQASQINPNTILFCCFLTETEYEVLCV